jgi:MFS family permease
MRGENPQNQTGTYFGWFVLAAAAVTEMLAQGATSYGSGLFVLPLQSEYGLSRADASSSVLILFLGAVFIAPIAGRVLDRYPIRIAVSAGAAIFCGALAFIALAPALWMMVLALLLPAALGFMLLGPLTTATLASRWFFRRRGLALGFATIATSGGGVLVVPLLSRAIALHGWRTALLEEAGLFFVIIILLALLVLKDNPFRAGLSEHPENKGRTDGAAFAGESHVEFSYARTILGNRGFWAPSLLVASISGLSQAIVVSLPAYGSQLGFDIARAAFLISAFSVAAAVTKLTAGFVADFWDKQLLLFGSAACMLISLSVLYFFASYGALMAGACLAGVALGGVLPISAAVIASRFGAARFGAVMGWTYALIAAITIAAVRFIGTVFDRTHSYHWAFAGLLAASVVVLAAAFLLDRRLPVSA